MVRRAVIPSVIHILSLETDLELREVGVADAKVPWYCDGLSHGEYLISDMYVHR